MIDLQAVIRRHPSRIAKLANEASRINGIEQQAKLPQSVDSLAFLSDLP
jgi:hypothetical protein